MKRTLVEFESWSVCETDDDNSVPDKEVFAEHYRDCEKVDCSPDQSSWSWEFDDPPNNYGLDVCWRCGGKVPKEVVALVQLHNWGRNRRNT